MSTTLTALRHALSNHLREPFFRALMGGSMVTTGTPTTTSIPLGASAAALWPDNDSWKKASLYLPSALNGAGEERRITGWLTGTATVTPGFTVTPDAGMAVEIHVAHSATEKNEAINRAIDESWPAFWELEAVEVLVPALTRLIEPPTFPDDWRRLQQAWHASATVVGPLTVDTEDGIDIYLSADDLALTLDVADTGWHVCPAATLSLESAPALTAAPTLADHLVTTGHTLSAGDTFYLVEPYSDDAMVRTDTLWPTTGDGLESIIVPRTNGNYIYRLLGLKRPARLSLNTATTNIPAAYITPTAGHLLTISNSQSAPGERWEAEFSGVRWTSQQSESLKRRLSWPWPAQTIWREPGTTPQTLDIADLFP